MGLGWLMEVYRTTNGKVYYIKKGSKLSSDVKLLNTPVGRVQASKSWAVFLTCEDFEIMLDDLMFVGLSCYPQPTKRKLVKIILPKGSNLQGYQRMKLKLAKGGVEFVEHLHQVFEGLVENTSSQKPS